MNHHEKQPIDARYRPPCINYLAFAVLAILSHTTCAQDAGAQDDAATLDTIKVTAIGTNIEGIKPVGSHSMALEREAMYASGLTTVVDVMRALPQVQSNDAYNEGGTVGGDNTSQGNALNLRGIGPSATLLLIDGRRIAPTGAAVSFTEANQVPMIALERVEVIADGASAVYGSDAIAGIVNYVLRKDFEGVEASWRFSDDGGFHQRVGSVLAGVAWRGGHGAAGGGHLVFAYERTDRDALVAGDNPLLKQDLRRYGGPDWRLNGNLATPGFSPNIVVPRADGSNNPDLPQAGPFDYYAVPSTSNGIGLGVSDLRYNQPNLVDNADYTDYIGEMERDQVSVFFNQQLNDRISVYAQGLYRRRHTISYIMSLGNFEEYGQYKSEVLLPASSPYYIAGIPGVAPGAPLVVQYNAYKDVGALDFTNDEKQLTWTAGLKADLAGGWKGEFYYTDSKNDACGYCNLGNFVNWDAIYAGVANGTINPLSSEPLSPAQSAAFLGQNLQFSTNTMKDAMLKFNGPVITLPGGKLRAAVGSEYTRYSDFLVNGAHRGASNDYIVDTASGLKREIKSLFAEIHVPLVGEGNAVSGIKSLSLSGAVRHDRYSDVGNTTNPKLGLTWEVNDALSLRGSWGESFRAPNFPDLNPFVYSFASVFPTANNSADADIVNGAFPGWANQLFILGSNAALTPETAKTWSAGIDYDFSRIDGLRVSATYYNISYENRIAQPPTEEFYANPENRVLWDAYITPIQQPANCIEGDIRTYDPALLPFLELPILFGGPITNYCAINVVSDGRYTNMAATRQTGLDIELNWAIPSQIGFWNLAVSTTRVLKHEQQLVPGQPMSDRRGMYNEPSSIRSRANIGWYHGDFGVNLFANYVGSYTNDLPVTLAGVRQREHRVGSWTTVDLGVTWSPMVDAKWLRGMRLGFNVNNLFDRDPPIVFSGNTAFNASKSNPFGRTWAVSVALDY